MIAMLIAVQIVAGSQPEMAVIPHGMMKIGACESMAKIKNASGPTASHDDKGRTIMFKEYQCVLLHRTDVDEAVEALKGEI